MCECVDKAVEEFRKIVKGRLVLFESAFVKLYVYKNEYVPDYRLVLKIGKELGESIEIFLPNFTEIEIDKDCNITLTKYLSEREFEALLKNAKGVRVEKFA